ncbi:MAG: phosphatase PAP2 family protein, partial [Pseudomonadota bacterium]
MKDVDSTPDADEQSTDHPESDSRQAPADTKPGRADAGQHRRVSAMAGMFQSAVLAIVRNGNTNISKSLGFLSRRSKRPSSIAALPRQGHRFQDMLAYGLLAFGISAILLDIGSYSWINSLPTTYYVFFWTFTDLGKAHWSLVPTGVAGLLILALNWETLARRTKELLHLIFLQAAYIFVVVAGSGLIAVVLKWSLGRARPKLSETLGPVHFDFFALDSVFTSFPSGHATTVGATAMCIALLV